MKVNATLVLKCIIALVIISVVSFLVYFLFVFGTSAIEHRKAIRQRQRRLLCETDYPVLLEACRELLRKVSAGDLKPGKYPVRRGPHPETTRFPQPILQLEPTYVDIATDEYVIVELFGGLDHFGVYAYPEDFKPTSSNFHYGDRKLINGLWYYDDGYANNPKYYGKGIEELIREGK